MNTKIMGFVAFWLNFILCCSCQEATKFPEKWEKGWFEIHHINTKLGDATFFIFPDGTTMLYDAGEIRMQDLSKEKQEEYFLNSSDTLTAGKKITNYIKQIFPKNYPLKIDYAVISHFHHDHYSWVVENSKRSKNGNYLLSGITEVHEYIPIKKLIDRGYPEYDYPLDLKNYYKNDLSFSNYLNFIDENKRKGKMIPEMLAVGTSKQIIPVNDPNEFKTFTATNVKSNNVIWTGKDTLTTFYSFPNVPLMNKEGKFNENPLSIVLLFEYGNFRYYTGGDTSGVDDWPDIDIESVIAPIVGEVDAMALNHHGYKDASNLFFLQTLNPQTIIQSSLHDPHFQDNVLDNISQLDCDVFALNMRVENKFSDEINQMYKGKNGHVVIKVAPGGEKYFVEIFDCDSDKLKVKEHLGPYYSNK